MRQLLLGLATSLLVATSASACINDSELPSHEREFRSQYNGPVTVSPGRSESQSVPILPILFLTGSVLGMIGCGVVAVRRTS